MVPGGRERPLCLRGCPRIPQAAPRALADPLAPAFPPGRAERRWLAGLDSNQRCCVRGYRPRPFGHSGTRQQGLRRSRPGALDAWNWMRRRDSNPRPSGYEPDELPDCSTPHQRRPGSAQGKLVGPARIELATPRLSTECSTAELRAIAGTRRRAPGRWMRELDSNQRPPAYEAGELTGLLYPATIVGDPRRDAGNLRCDRPRATAVASLRPQPLAGGLPGNWMRRRDSNARPSGYEPDELPGCSTPHQGEPRRRRRGEWFGRQGSNLRPPD